MLPRKVQSRGREPDPSGCLTPSEFRQFRQYDFNQPETSQPVEVENELPYSRVGTETLSEPEKALCNEDRFVENFHFPINEAPERRLTREAVALKICNKCPLFESGECQLNAVDQKLSGYWAGMNNDELKLKIIEKYPPPPKPKPQRVRLPRSFSAVSKPGK